MINTKQIGYVGNSVKVRALPEPTAITYGQGNRFYTLIGTQANYITNHTYRTIIDETGTYLWVDIDDSRVGKDNPIIVTTEDEMVALMTDDENIGKFIRYEGEDGVFLKGATYEVVSDAEEDVVQYYTYKITEEGLPDIDPTPSLVYTLSSDGKYYIIGTGFTSVEAIEADIGGGTEGSGLDSTWQGGRVVIPAMHNGKPVRAIAPRAFSAYYNITQVYIYDGITHLGHRCFNCPNSPWDTAMTSCRLPNTLVYIGGEDGRVFYGRQGLTSMAIPMNVPDLTRAVFAYCNSLTAAYTQNVRKLVRSCFQDCSALTKLNTDNLEEIGDVTFYNCRSLTELNLPKIKTIGNNVFYDTKNLTKVTIGPDCSSIDVSGLRCGSSSNKCTFRFEGKTPPTIASTTFTPDNVEKIEVKVGCGNAYKTATNWTTVASKIVEVDF